ncbi:hypothetical protein BGZ54_005827 [Gamsiella multidivaricata]|nr:hypothetical protein BGZ54_005827 [Gamsiella multidivaricata]
MSRTRNTNKDLVFALSQPRAPLTTAKYCAKITCKNRKPLEIYLFLLGHKACIKVSATSSRAFEGFKYMSVLNSKNRILSLNQTGCKSREISDRNLVHKEGLIDFKILFQATKAIYKPPATYPSSSDVEEAFTLAPFVAQAPSRLEAPREPAAPNAHITDMVSQRSSQENSPLSFDLSAGLAYDVHFSHYNPVTGIHNLVATHRSRLQEYPTLYRIVERAEDFRNDLAMDMRFSTQGTSSSASRPPVMVDISYLPFMAFKVLISYAYTRDIKAALRNISAVTPASSLPTFDIGRPEEAPVPGGLILCIDDLLRLARRFEMSELFETCVELIILTLTVETAVPILVLLGCDFEEVKGPALDYIKHHFQEIFGRDDATKHPFKQFCNHPASNRLMGEILKMVARNFRPDIPASSVISN